MAVRVYPHGTIEYDPGDDVEGWFSISFHDFDPEYARVSVGTPNPEESDYDRRGDIKVPVSELVEFFYELEKHLFGKVGRPPREKPVIHESTHYDIPHRCPEDCPSELLT